MSAAIGNTPSTTGAFDDGTGAESTGVAVSEASAPQPDTTTLTAINPTLRAFTHLNTSANLRHHDEKP
ncbi:hypothetical protein [Nocardia coubleae]|uniref:Uncharacterized protein n=1 Tax=Nocardia coubleae TaxID=356147 RepID=A0A846W9P4_9NOCA|nr:hypothetical protein [Nocardia coubleae]NKX89118.1 hypothetical protein [Nocardia coubleae]